MSIAGTIVADSIYKGNRITTFNVIYPRIAHAHLLTHRLFSRNTSSSRAIPVVTMVTNMLRDMAVPNHFGKKQKGMVSGGIHTDPIHLPWEEERLKPINAWKSMGKVMGECALAWDEAGYHKEIVNRIIEPYSHINVLITATEFGNFYKLRRAPDAQAEIRTLANLMYQLQAENVPKQLKLGEYHLPFVKEDELELNLQDKICISAARCARISYARHNDTKSLDEDRVFHNRLISDGHLSPLEHQATPMDQLIGVVLPYNSVYRWEKGVTYMDRDMNLWSGNFKGFIQYRQLLDLEYNEK